MRPIRESTRNSQAVGSADQAVKRAPLAGGIVAVDFTGSLTILGFCRADIASFWVPRGVLEGFHAIWFLRRANELIRQSFLGYHGARLNFRARGSSWNLR
jgi:hypothetical protein